MKTVKIPTLLVLTGMMGWGFTVPNGTCQPQSPAREDELVKIAPKSILDSCSEAERKFRIYLARFSPKELRDTTVLKSNGLRVGSFWIGDLGPDSAEYALIHYRCYESGYLVIFKKNLEQGRDFLWQSPDLKIASNFARLGEPEDVNKDGNKEIFFFYPERNALDTMLALYTWNGKTAHPIGQISGNSIEIKDLNGDGIKEIIANHNRYIWNQAEDTLVTDSDFYRWDRNSYKRYDSKRATSPIKD